MSYTTLLQRQLKRYFHSIADIPPELHDFLEAVNSSYGHYERDHLLGKRSLEISSTELHQLMENLTQEEARLRAVLQFASDGIVVFNEKNEIELCNPVAAKGLGFLNENEILGKNAASIPVSLLGPIRYETTLQGVFYQKNQNKFNEIAIRNSIFELSISKFEYANQAYKLCILRDITQRKLSEKIIGVRHAVTHVLSLSRSIEVTAKKILSILCDELDWDLAFFWLQDGQREQMAPLFFYDPKSTPFSSAFVHDSLSSSFGKNSLQKKEPQFFFDASYFRMKEASRYSFKGCFIIPFVFEEEVIGFIELFSRTKTVEDFEIKKIFYDIGAEIALNIMQQYTEERVADLQQELLSSARQLGRSQVANSTLHNVGNALNTLTTSASLLQESREASELQNLPKIASMLKEHKDDLSTFILKDPKGKHLPKYLIALSEWWEKDQKNFQNQLKQLSVHIQQIQKIIKTQQAVDRLGGLKEKISINLLLDDMLGLLSKDLRHFGIEVEKNYHDLPDIIVEKSAIVQILENLFLNAIDALSSKEEDKRLTVSTRLVGSDTLQIEITDNGIGIAANQIKKIFSYGFTLKEAGHGYGLHNSAKLAKELGGQLIAKSEGLEKGASFFFSIPTN